jgi:hypothetical protein
MFFACNVSSEKWWYCVCLLCCIFESTRFWSDVIFEIYTKSWWGKLILAPFEFHTAWTLCEPQFECYNFCLNKLILKHCLYNITVSEIYNLCLNIFQYNTYLKKCFEKCISWIG